MIALLLALSLIPAHVMSWYYYGLNNVNADVPVATMVRYADFVEDDGFTADHAMAYKRAGGRYAVAYTDPAFVPYCHPPFRPPAGHCEGPIGNLVTDESAWFHGPDGTRIRHFVGGEFDYQEALNPASRAARAAWVRKTEQLVAAAPLLDFLFADDSGGPLRVAGGDALSGHFYGFNAAGVEITGDAAFRAAWISYLDLAPRPLIINGYDPSTGLPSYGGAFLEAPDVRGALHEGCLRGGSGVDTDAGDHWRFQLDSLIANTALHRYAVCFLYGRPDDANRLYTLASWWLTYDPQWSVFAPSTVDDKSALLPELDVVPRDPVRTASHTVRELRVAGGAYAREFRACYQAGVPIGPCATVVNPTPQTVSFPRLDRHYRATLQLIGGDVLAGGRIAWARGTPASLAPARGVIVRTAP